MSCRKLKLYFDKVVDVLISTDPKGTFEKCCINFIEIRSRIASIGSLFHSIYSRTNNQSIMNIEILSTMLEVILALVDNKTIFWIHMFMH